jgi:hypothetical protein
MPCDSAAFSQLAAIGRVSASLQEFYARPQTFPDEAVEPALGAAFAGLGMVMEYLSHQVLEAARTRCGVPIELTAVEVGPGIRGREIVSIDISEYGDPLSSRGIRMPFSAYLKPLQQRHLLGEPAVESLPPLFMIPLHEMDERQGLVVMRDPRQAADLARRASVAIPDQSDAMARLILAYDNSRLAQFHRAFSADEHDPCERWPETYDRTPLDPLPACVRILLQQPNDLLLKPGEVQHLVRTLTAFGWRPRHIAGLIRSKLERDYGWGDAWHRRDPSMRADFYTRMFAGLIATGLDELIDFNCRSTIEKQYCPMAQCGINLLGLQAPLRENMQRFMADSVKTFSRMSP